MLRTAALLMFALAFFQGSGAAAVVAELSCAGEHHDSEGPAQQCPPECASCACCGRTVCPPPLAIVPVGEPVLPAMACLDYLSIHHEDPAPRGILHVPRFAA